MSVSDDGSAGVGVDAQHLRILEQVRASSGELRAAAPHLSGEEASELLRRVTAATADFDALRLVLVARIEESGVWQQDPNATPNSWLRAEQRLDHRSAQADLRAARALSEYPTLREAAEAGDLSRAHVDAIVSIGEANEIRRQRLGEFMHIFVDVGTQHPVSDLKTVMRAWADQVDPLGMAGDEHEAHQRRYLHVNMLADGVHVEGFFAKEEGAKIIAALNAALTKSRRSAVAGHASETQASETQASGNQLNGRAAVEPELPVRSTAQQRADAFIAGIIDPALESGGLPSSGGARPAVAVLVPLDRLERPCGGGGGAYGAGSDSLADAADLKGSPSVAEPLPFVRLAASIGVTNGSGTVLISPEAAQRLTCDCEVHRILIDPQGLPLDVGRTMRTFPPHMRKALVVRDKGCVFPGCDKPPGWAEAHHIVHWAQGGKTSLNNAALLCSKHHHQVHSEGHQVMIGPDGRGRVLVKSTRLRR